MAKREVAQEPPFRELDDEEIVAWPPDHFFGFVRHIDEVDRITLESKESGRAREAVRALRALMQSEAEDGVYCVLADPSGAVGCLAFDRMADLVYQTKSSMLATKLELSRLAVKAIELVKVIGSESPHYCSAYVGLAFSISGRHPDYPPLSILPHGGCPFHPGCTKRFVAFVEGLQSEAGLKASQLPAKDRAMVDPSTSTEARLMAAMKRVRRLGYK